MTRFDPKERKAIIAAYRGGATSVEVGKRFNVHPAYVRKLAARSGPVRRAKVVAPLPAEEPPKRITPPQAVLPMHIGSGRHYCSGYLKLM